MSCLWTGWALYCCLAMHAMPEWFAMHESWCSAYNNTNDPIAGVYLLYKEKAVQNHGIVLLKNSNTWQPTVKHWNMVLQMELQFLVLPVPPYSTKLKRQVLSIYLSHKDGGPLYYMESIAVTYQTSTSSSTVSMLGYMMITVVRFYY